jgi:acyl-CoA thioester hydrolase
MQTKTHIEVRFPECDRMGIVHHAVYPIWYEIARMDFFKELGFSFSDMFSLGVNPAMVDLHLQYKAPARYPQSLYIITRMGEYAPKKLELFYDLYNLGSGEPINTARSFHIWTGPDNKSYNIAKNLPHIYEKIKKAAGD